MNRQYISSDCKRSSAEYRFRAGISGWHAPFFVDTHNRLRTCHFDQQTRRTKRVYGSGHLLVWYGVVCQGMAKIWYDLLCVTECFGTAWYVRVPVWSGMWYGIFWYGIDVMWHGMVWYRRDADRHKINRAIAKNRSSRSVLGQKRVGRITKAASTQFGLT